MKVNCNNEAEARVMRKALKEFRDRPVTEDQSHDGVRVLVHRREHGTTVEADCLCFGNKGRCHSNPNCPNMGGKA